MSYAPPHVIYCRLNTNKMHENHHCVCEFPVVKGKEQRGGFCFFSATAFPFSGFIKWIVDVRGRERVGLLIKRLNSLLRFNLVLIMLNYIAFFFLHLSSFWARNLLMHYSFIYGSECVNYNGPI